MATGAKEVAVPPAAGACARGAAYSNWSTSQSGRGGAMLSPSSGPRGHIGEGKLKLHFCTVPHFDQEGCS